MRQALRQIKYRESQREAPCLSQSTSYTHCQEVWMLRFVVRGIRRRAPHFLLWSSIKITAAQASWCIYVCLRKCPAVLVFQRCITGKREREGRRTSTHLYFMHAAYKKKQKEKREGKKKRGSGCGWWRGVLSGAHPVANDPPSSSKTHFTRWICEGARVNECRDV